MMQKSHALDGIEISPQNSEQVIKEYAPMIKYVANRIALRLPPQIEVDDLISVGVLGLMDAIEKFDPHRGAKFKTYAEFRVRGAILDELRSMDWVPRSVRQKASIQTIVTAQLTHLDRSSPNVYTRFSVLVQVSLHGNLHEKIKN